VVEDMNDFILMKIFKLKKEDDYKKMHKIVKEMKNVEDTDELKRTMKKMNKKERPLFRETEEKKFSDVD